MELLDVPSSSTLRGLDLRSVLVLLLLERRRPMTVGQLVDAVIRAGWRVEGRASKTISDALRWEVLRGRVVRTDRGAYAVGVVAKVTKHRMRHRVAAQVPPTRRRGSLSL